MSKIEIDLTKSQLQALAFEFVDPAFFFRSQAEGRANKAIEDIVQLEMQRALDAGENLPTTKDEIVEQAFANGTVKTAAEKAEELQAAQTIEAPTPETPEQSLSVKVLAHALALKVGVVNALRTDGGDPYPVSSDALAAVHERYTDMVNDYNTRVSVAHAKKVPISDVVTDMETNIVQLIQQGFALFAAINDAAEAIIQSGEVSDPVAADPRWPQLGA